MSRARAWCFTVNHPTESDRTWCETVDCRYIVYGDEVGESGTPHLQGYVEFANQKALSVLKKGLPRAHFETRKGTSKQAAEYCMKDGKYVERGERSEQGHRSDLDAVAEKAIAGATTREIAMDHPTTFIRYERGIRALQEIAAKPRDFRPHVVWLYGPTGSGKSRRATDHTSVYIKDNTKWWDGYDHEERIVIDDFDPYSWNLQYLLRLLDRYAFRGERKGGYVTVNSREIYITAIHPPERYFGCEEDLKQVLRRIDEKIDLSESQILPISGVSEVAGNTVPPPSSE